MLNRSKPEESDRLLDMGQRDILRRWKMYEQLANVDRAVAEDLAGKSSD